MERHPVLIGLGLTILLLLTGWAYAQGTALEHETTTQAGLGTAFTYQGQLSDEASPVDRPCDLAFVLYDDPEAVTPLGSLERPDHPISGGIFTVQLDYHRLDRDTLPKIPSQYLWPQMESVRPRFGDALKKRSRPSRRWRSSSRP